MSQPKPYPLRMSDEMRNHLQQCADNAGRSLNAEIVQRLQSTIDEGVEFADGRRVAYLEGMTTDQAARILPPGTVLIPQEAYNPQVLSDEMREVRELLNSIRKVMTDEMKVIVRKDLDDKK